MNRRVAIRKRLWQPWWERDNIRFNHQVHACPKAPDAGNVSSTELVSREVSLASPLTTNAQGTHETGVRNISPGLLWAVGKNAKEVPKVKPDFRAFYWKEHSSEIGEEANPVNCMH
jgi:hypothetical protein